LSETPSLDLELELDQLSKAGDELGGGVLTGFGSLFLLGLGIDNRFWLALLGAAGLGIAAGLLISRGARGLIRKREIRKLLQASAQEQERDASSAEQLLLWVEELERIEAMPDHVAISAVLAFASVLLVMLGLDSGDLALTLVGILPGAAAGFLIQTDRKMGKKRRELEGLIEGRESTPLVGSDQSHAGIEASSLISGPGSGPHDG
jgi:hypothetical protein